MSEPGGSKHDSAEIETGPVGIEETTPLLRAEQDLYQTCSQTPVTASTEGKVYDEKSVFGVISVLLIGVFVSSADVTLVMATYADIASGFNALESGSWLLTSCGLASCVTQPLYGKLSDIFGRKTMLQTSYTIFFLGTFASGLAQSMTQVIIARVAQGAGAAGMVSMVSVLLTDLVPLHEVAMYRSYVNIFSTVGRSCGGLVGGFLAEAVGWRWAFLCQCPLLLLSIGLVWWRLEDPKLKYTPVAQTTILKWKRIDFLGSLFMSLTILPVLLAADLGGKHNTWNSPLIIGLCAGAVLSGVLFCLTEKYWAKEPVFPLRLLGHYVVVTSYLQLLVQVAIQTALMFSVPLYFQATENASTGEAGVHLVPAVIGNTIGGLLVGAWIKKTGRYKIPTVLSSCFAILAFTLLIILWRGHTNTSQSCVIFFGGFGTGMAQSAIFVGLTAGIERENIAIAASGLYLSANIGAVAGISAAGSIFQSSLRWQLDRLLSKETDGSEIIKKVLSDVGYLKTLHGRLHDVVVNAFVMSIQKTFQVALFFAGIALVIALVSRQTRLTH